jgi:hypothetical protein
MDNSLTHQENQEQPEAAKNTNNVSLKSMSRTIKILFLATFLLSCALRAAFVRINRESNDNHVQVVKIMLSKGSLPEKKDCSECFQPKLYHFTIAKIIQGLGWTNLINDNNDRIVVAELLNLLAGILTLLVVFDLIRRLPDRNEWLKFLGFALVALNPQLIGINSQATNDTFLILFSTLALYCTYFFLQKQKIIIFLLMILFVCLGVSSKTNGWVIAIAILMTLLIQAWIKPEWRKKTLIYAAAFLVACPALSVLNPLNQYVSNYQKYGSPVLLNMDPQALPPVFLKVPYDQAGILSIYDGFFSFKFSSLLGRPRLVPNVVNYPLHRNSFWTLLYATAHSASFQWFPPTWRFPGTSDFVLNRGIFSLALLPTFLLIIGTILQTYLVLKSLLKRDQALAQTTSYSLWVMTFIGYILFEALYVLNYQVFYVIKAIFVFPALLTFPVLFIHAGERLYTTLFRRAKWSTYVLDAVMIALLVLYVLEVVLVIINIFNRTGIKCFLPCRWSIP